MAEQFAKTLCILLSGKAGVGKTTTAGIIKNYLDEMGYSSYVGHFATGVKEISLGMGWDGEKDPKGRKLLQQVGTVGREYDVDTWCKDLFKRISLSQYYPYDVVIVDDWRFPNEEKFANNLLEYNTFTVQIVSPEREILKGTPAAEDISETALDNQNIVFDALLYNQGSMEDLEEFCHTIADIFVKLNPKWEEKS